MPRTPRMKMKQTAKQLAASKKNILAYERKDDRTNFTNGFMVGAMFALIVAWIFTGL
jgi:hypothetical protein